VFTTKVNDLFTSQLTGWELARVNYGLLSKVRTKHLDFGNFEVKVQFNPERLRSSAAKVDAKSIEKRPCFLCKANRPPQQKDLIFSDKYTILVNPFPIFSRHLTISAEMHTDQRIKDNFEDLLILAEALPDFVIFYNGPQCGASAPDHLHFQAGNREFLPVEKDFFAGKLAVLAGVKGGIEIWQWHGYYRGIITLKGYDRKGFLEAFTYLYDRLSDIQPGRPEPMLNILASSESSSLIIHIIPRKVHRPAQFFLEGSNQMLISPASVDLGGVIITPREEDFNRLGKDVVIDIFRQVCYDENELESLIEGYL
jgi:hypothetical protein